MTVCGTDDAIINEGLAVQTSTPVTNYAFL